MVDRPAPEPSYASWEPILSKLASEAGTTLVLGVSDTGKTTFCRSLLHRLSEQGRSPLYLDADLGQTEVGAPFCVGIAAPERLGDTLHFPNPLSVSFVGSPSPVGSGLEYLNAILRLARLAESRRLVIDMSVSPQGATARMLYHTLIETLAPSQLVAFQRKEELTPLLHSLRRRADCQTTLPEIPMAITPRTQSYRMTRRAMRFSAYFDAAPSVSFGFDAVGLHGAWLGNGTPPPPHVLKFIREALSEVCKVYHAEMWGVEMGLMTNRAVSQEDPRLAMAMQHLRIQSVAITVAPQLKNLLLGLEDNSGNLLALGILERLDFRGRSLGVRTPLRFSGACSNIRFGNIRLQSDGKEIGGISSPLW